MLILLPSFALQRHGTWRADSQSEQINLENGSTETSRTTTSDKSSFCLSPRSFHGPHVTFEPFACRGRRVGCKRASSGFFCTANEIAACQLHPLLLLQGESAHLDRRELHHISRNSLAIVLCIAAASLSLYSVDLEYEEVCRTSGFSPGHTSKRRRRTCSG